MLRISCGRRLSPTTPRPGSSISRVASPRSLAMRRSYGHDLPWPGMCVSKRCQPAILPWPERLTKATVQRILDAQPLHPHKVTYYLERRDPRFLPKMPEVLLVYKQVALQNEAVRKGAAQPIVITVSVDEKPGVQAIGNTAPDLPPVAGKYPTVARDHEYIRYGTWSILAGLDLHDGHVTAR